LRSITPHRCASIQLATQLASIHREAVGSVFMIRREHGARTKSRLILRRRPTFLRHHRLDIVRWADDLELSGGHDEERRSIARLEQDFAGTHAPPHAMRRDAGDLWRRQRREHERGAGRRGLWRSCQFGHNQSVYARTSGASTTCSPFVLENVGRRRGGPHPDGMCALLHARGTGPPAGRSAPGHRDAWIRRLVGNSRDVHVKFACGLYQFADHKFRERGRGSNGGRSAG